MGDVIEFKMIRRVAVLSSKAMTGWTKEINLVSWNGAPAKYDIREWSPDHSNMSRGMSLTKEEMENFLMAMRNDPDMEYLNDVK